MPISYTNLHQDGSARQGVIHTAHGNIPTPVFMTVGTTGSVKGIDAETLEDAKAPIILANTYHLLLRPGEERMRKWGGLHKLMAWPHPILTDSGGYQVMSLADLRQIDDDGISFKSHIDGAAVRLTPKNVISMQEACDSTITMVLDECTMLPASDKIIWQAMERSLQWAKLSQDHYRHRPGYALFAIIQGGFLPDCRLASLESSIALNFDGYALGGLAVGESRQERLDVLNLCLPKMPATKPRYLMGVGKPDDIIEAVACGIDMFDCVLPTRNGRNGQAFTSVGAVNIRNAAFQEDMSPLDPSCSCPTCHRYSRAYINHLFRLGEMLGPILMSQHNIFFYQHLMQTIQQSIRDQKFSEWSEAFLNRYSEKAP